MGTEGRSAEVSPAAEHDLLLAEARRLDPLRAQAAILAPPGRRAAVLAVLVLDRELARIPAAGGDPMLAAIRCQWWREALDGRSEHPVLTALGPLIACGELDRADLMALVDAREADAGILPPVAIPELEAWARARAGVAHVLIARAGGCAQATWLEGASDVGTALGITGRALAARSSPGGAAGEQSAAAERALALIARARALGGAPRAALAALAAAAIVRHEAGLLRAGRARPPATPLLSLRIAWTGLTHRV